MPARIIIVEPLLYEKIVVHFFFIIVTESPTKSICSLRVDLQVYEKIETHGFGCAD